MLPINQLLSITNRTVLRNKQNKYIVVHWVGSVSTAWNNAKYFYEKYRGASANYFVDDNEIWQCVDDGNAAWHCGSNKYYHDECRNKNSIGVEMCCKKEKGILYISEQTTKNTQELVRYLMDKYNIPIENVLMHYDVTRKECPKPYVQDTDKWVEFKRGLIQMKNITDLKEAFDLLENTGRMTDRPYWEKVVLTTRNTDHLILKWANDVYKLINKECE